MVDARQHATHAILVLSADYLNSDYCRAEYEALVDNNIPIIAVIARDIPVNDFTSQIQVVDWIDFRTWSDEVAFAKTIKSVLDQLPNTQQSPIHSEQRFYLYGLIDMLESSLMTIPTSRAMNLANGEVNQEATIVRPRGYSFTSLIEKDLTYLLAKDSTPIPDLVSWLGSSRQFILSAPSGSGKTVIGKLLTLWQAHRTIADTSVALPIWFDLADYVAGESMEQFVETHWPLAFHWRHWLDTHTAFFVFDNWSSFCDQHPDAIDDVANYINELSEHRLVVITRNITPTPFEMPVVTIDMMQNHQTQRFGRQFLDDAQTTTFKRMAAENKVRLEYCNIDFVSCGIELIATDTALAIDSWFTNPIISLINVRWQTQHEDIRPSFSMDYFIKTMRMLAWHIMQQEHYDLVDYEIAQKVVFQEEALQVALTLGILETVGHQLKFHAQLFQWYLATDHLVRDGLYKHLTHPQFLNNGQRVVSKWDNVVFALVDTVSETRRVQIVDQIAEIDPYLAWMCIQHHPQLYATYLSQIIAKLVELRSQNPSSQQALTAALQKIPYSQQMAVSLINQIPKYDWAIQQWLWIELLRLPVAVPKAFIANVRGINRQAPDAAKIFLDAFSLQDCTVYLAHLLNHKDRLVQTNAVWLSGELGHPSAKIGLFTVLDNTDFDIRREAITALSHLADENLIQKLLIWLAQHPEHGTDVGVLLHQNGRLVSGQLLMILYEDDPTDDLALRNAIIKHPEKTIALALADYISTVTNENPLNGYEFEKEEIMNVQKLLQSGMERLPRESFIRLVEEIQRVLGISAIVSNGASHRIDEDTFNRIQTAVTASRPSAQAELNQDEIITLLHHDDWFVRREATEQLASLEAETALPLLVTAANDPESHVRIVALNQLAQFTDYEIALDTLISSLSDTEYLVIDTATDLLKECEELDEDLLLNLFDTDSVQTLAALIEIAGYRQYENTVSQIATYLDDERKPWLGEKTLNDCAVDALTGIGTPEALEIINQHGFEDDDDVVPTDESVTQTEKKSGSYTTVEKITLSLKALRSDNWELAQKAARFLRDLAQKHRGSTDMNIIQPLCDALTDSNWHVRWTVTEALAWLQHPSCIPNLVPRLNDTNWIVQVAAVRALVELKASQQAPDIANLLKHPNTAVREAAAEALGMLENPSVIPALEQTFENDDDFIRLASIKSIQQILDEHKAKEHLLWALEDKNVHIKWFAAQHLIPMLGESEIDLLAQLLQDYSKPAWEEMSIHDFAQEGLLRINSATSKKIISDHSRLNEQGDL